MKKTLLILAGLLTFLFSNAQSYNAQQAIDAWNAKDYDKALDYFSRELKDNPKEALPYYYRALIYNSKEQNAAALSDINNSIKYYSSKDKTLLAQAHCLRGNIYLEIENYDKALEDYGSAIKLTRDDPDIYFKEPTHIAHIGKSHKPTH